MKQVLFLSCSLLLAVSAAGQGHKNEAHRINHFSTIEPAVFPTAAATAKLNPHAQTLSVPYTRFSSAMNAFGFVTNEQNALTYNPDVNCVAFFQRHTADWPNSAFLPPPGSGKSGYQVVKFTTNNGASWDSVNYYQDEAYWGRYPGGAIYNPAGNTSLANAWFVGTGPATGPAPNDNWYANWFASVKIPTLSDPRTVTTNDQQFAKNNQAGSLCNKTYYSSYSTTIGGPAATRTVYSGGLKLTGTPVVTSLIGVYGVAIFKGIFNGSNGFTWVQDSSFINKWTVSGGSADVSGPKIAFSADGMTGYIVINGSDATATLPAAKQSYQPMVWKTADGGTTWNRVNVDYDWVNNHPEILFNLRSTTNPSVTMPAFFDTYGGGVTVDANGKLHYATAVSPAYSTHTDSLGFGFLYPFVYQQHVCDDHPWIYDFVTDGSGTWDALHVADLYTAPLGRSTAADSNAAMNLWTNGAEYIDYDNKIRVSRSADGTKIFYTWIDGDTTNLLQVYNASIGGTYPAYSPNVYPDLHYKGLDITTGMFSQDHVNPGLNTNSGGFWFYTAPDVALTNGGGVSYTIPCTYIDSRPGTFNGLAEVDVYYADDNTIMQTEFTQGPPSPCMIGIKTNNLSSSVGLFPNPTAGAATLKVSLEKAEQLTVIVKDQLGRIISTQTAMGVAGQNLLAVDISTASSGVYFCTVKTEKEAVTRKLSVIK
jgi:hypothetical protein